MGLWAVDLPEPESWAHPAHTKPRQFLLFVILSAAHPILLSFSFNDKNVFSFAFVESFSRVGQTVTSIVSGICPTYLILQKRDQNMLFITNRTLAT